MFTIGHSPWSCVHNGSHISAVVLIRHKELTTDHEPHGKISQCWVCILTLASGASKDDFPGPRALVSAPDLCGRFRVLVLNLLRTPVNQKPKPRNHAKCIAIEASPKSLDPGGIMSS
jgi:hypothetical protein